MRCETTFYKNLRIPSSYLNTFLFTTISKKLELGTYKYSFSKKIAVRNRDSSDTKVVVLSNFCDVVIQKAFFRVLQQIYEGVSIWQPVDFDTFKACNNNDNFDGLVSKRFFKNKNRYEVKK